MRRSGRTTRLVDQYIQELLNCPDSFPWIEIPDHHEGGGHYEANKHLVHILLNRLRSEHGALLERCPVEVRWSDGKFPMIKFKDGYRR